MVTLGIKIALSVSMFILARGRRRRPALLDAYRQTPGPTTRLRGIVRVVSGYNAIVIFGIVVFLLSDLLKVLFEMALS